MFSGIKLWLILGAIAAIGGLLWHDKMGWDKLKSRNAELAQANATIASEKVNRAIEQQDRRQADESAKRLQDELNRIRDQPVLSGVRCTAPRLPRTASQSNPATAVNGEAARPEPEVSGEDPVGRDVSAGLTEYGKQCEATAATLEALQAWELQRSH